MFEHLPLKPPVEPMEAKSAASIPKGDGWLYEPKWDGFRCIAFRDGADVLLQSKSGQPLERYFPEVVKAIVALPVSRFVLDGELAIELEGRLDFDALLQRIHPAATRIEKLSKQTPAAYHVFDQLADRTDETFARPLRERRARLTAFADECFDNNGSISLSPATDDRDQAQRWLSGGMKWFDGVIAKKATAPYRFGERDAVLKVKRIYTADCVVGGFRLSKDNTAIGSLLLGLYGEDGLLHLVGFIGSLNAAEREHALRLLQPLVAEPGFTGARPGGVSRWGSRDAQWFPLKPDIVVEVQFDHVTGTRFRHGARFLRWRPDKSPRSCTMDQLLAAR